MFTLFGGAQKGFMKVLKAFIKPFEAPQRSVKMKKKHSNTTFYFNTTFNLTFSIKFGTVTGKSAKQFFLLEQQIFECQVHGIASFESMIIYGIDTSVVKFRVSLFQKLLGKGCNQAKGWTSKWMFQGNILVHIRG